MFIKLLKSFYFDPSNAKEVGTFECYAEAVDAMYKDLDKINRFEKQLIGYEFLIEDKEIKENKNESN